MKVSIADAQKQLADLVRRAAAGEEVILTFQGQDAVRLTPAAPPIGEKSRRSVLEEVRASARQKAKAGPSAARSQDFLYMDDGMPA